MTILTYEPPIVNDETDASKLPDGVYDFDDPVDRYVVVIGGQYHSWALVQCTAHWQYTEALRVNGEHGRRCPEDIPFQGEPCPYNDDETAESMYGLEPAF